MASHRLLVLSTLLCSSWMASGFFPGNQPRHIVTWARRGSCQALRAADADASSSQSSDQPLDEAATLEEIDVDAGRNLLGRLCAGSRLCATPLLATAAVSSIHIHHAS